MTFELDQDALDDVLGGLRGLQRRADRPEPALLEVADELRGLADRAFRTRDRGRWAPVTPEYAARKAAEGRGRTVGRYTGTLQDSLTRSGARFARQTLRPDSVTVLTRAPHAHLFDSGRRSQTPRKLFRIRPADATRLRLIVSRYLLTGQVR